MWSEAVSAINLQTLKSMLKSRPTQKCAIFTFKIQKLFWGGSMAPSQDLTLFMSPQFAPCSQYLWIRQWNSGYM